MAQKYLIFCFLQIKLFVSSFFDRAKAFMLLSLVNFVNYSFDMIIL